jgi:hypothetical protein
MLKNPELCSRRHGLKDWGVDGVSVAAHSAARDLVD